MVGPFAAPEVELGALTAPLAAGCSAGSGRRGRVTWGRLTAFAGQGSTVCCSACREFSLLPECM